MKIKINSKKEIYRLNDNYCYVNNKIINENGIIREILKKENLKKEIDIEEEKQILRIEKILRKFYLFH